MIDYNNPPILKKYKDVWYGGFIPRNLFASFAWVISDTQGMYSNVVYVNADVYRLDEAIGIFNNEIKTR